MSKKKLTEIIQEKAAKLLELMGSNAGVEVEEKDGSYLVKIDAKDETGLLIGRRGDTINSIQSFLVISLREELEEGHIIVDVGDWREKQEEKLKDLADQVAQRAIETKEPQSVYNLTPGQRRVVHMQLAKKGDVETESTGEGEERYLIVKPKASGKEK